MSFLEEVLAHAESCGERLGDDPLVAVHCDRRAGHLGPHSGPTRTKWPIDVDDVADLGARNTRELARWHREQQAKVGGDMEQKPSQGRIVRFVETNHAADQVNGQHPLTTWPAMVVLVHEDGRVGLDVTKPYGLHEWHEAVPYSVVHVNGSWHWPPRD